MQVLVMLVFLAIWLLVLWFGSIALEATGMERPKARFQSLSALSGTGFTTREAESVINHPRRRRIVAWLIFLGNTGMLAFLILLIQSIRSGFTRPSLLFIVVVVIIFLVVALIIWSRIVDLLGDAILSFLRGRRRQQPLVTEEILYQAGPYGLVRLAVSGEIAGTGTTIRGIGLPERGITVLAIERKDAVLPMPAAGERVLSGDQLLCYGKVAEITGKS